MNQVNPTQMDQMQKAIDIVSNVQARGVSPDQVMNVIASQNPEVANMMQFVNQFGDPKQAVYELARQRGLDVNRMISMYNQLSGIRR